ncbi:MAG: aminopeptidase, partial [Candidatus Izemoplasmatales bacterium]
MLRDLRLQKLASTLINYSVRMQPNETVMIYSTIKAKPLILELIKVIRANKGNPIVEFSDDEINRETLLATSDKSLDRNYRWLDWKLNDIYCIINIRASESDYTSADVPVDIKHKVANKMSPLTPKRLGKKWVLLNYPTEGRAHKAKMSYEMFFDYIVNVSNVDYSKMNDAFIPLKELMEKTDKVRIVAKNTDIAFSIKDMPAIPCA